MTAFFVLAWVAGYLLIGGLVAGASIPRLWDRALRQHTESRTDYTTNPWSEVEMVNENAARLSVVGGVIVRWFSWPVMGAYELLARQIDRTNPLELQRQIDTQQARIVELERELEVGE